MEGRTGGVQSTGGGIRKPYLPVFVFMVPPAGARMCVHGRPKGERSGHVGPCGAAETRSLVRHRPLSTVILPERIN